MRGWWRRKSSAARFDLHARGSLYVNFVLVPVLVLVAVAPELGGALAWVIPLLLAHAVLCIAALRAGLGHYLGQRDLPVRTLVGCGALAVAGSTAGHLAFPDPSPGHPDSPATAILLIMVGMAVAAAAVAVTPEFSVFLVLTATGAAYGLSALRGVVEPGPALAYGMLLGFLAAAYRTTAWMTKVVWELDGARDVAARLAVAEERLRFSRDLHDVVGRTLSVVALKAELAAQLTKRGRPEALDEMLEVRRVAQESLAELRTLVGGYRTVDPEVELAGARSLLASAGIDCRVTGSTGNLPDTLGWVVREGTTNVLRHSEARTCVITLVEGPAELTVTMDNDGVPDGAGPVVLGNGLTGLTERLAGLGGTLTTERIGGRFRLTVRLPDRHPDRLPDRLPGQEGGG